MIQHHSAHANSSRLKVIFAHVLLWLVFWVISVFAYPKMLNGDIQFLESFIHQLFFLTGKIILTYWTLYFLFPKFFAKRKYWTFALLLILSVIGAGLLQRGINYFYYRYIYDVYFNVNREPLKLSYWVGSAIIQTIFVTYPPAVIALCIKAFDEWFRTQRRIQKAENEQLYSELKYLQAQIHPHFFFNTLNNLYGLALAKSDEAPGLILKLSDMMRYILYQTNVPSIGLEKELHHLHNYIELEKIRYKDNFDIFFKQRGPLHEVSVAPLLLLPFVENAFKHGFSESMQNAYISIDIDVSENVFLFSVENSLPVTTKNTEIETGLGLKNVMRRLELLYPGSYTLKLHKGDDSYRVELSLPKVRS
jgi:two-component system LytT family sensor kinase